MTSQERINAVALVWLAKALCTEYHRGRHEAVGDLRLPMLDRRVEETWHTFIPRASYAVELLQEPDTDGAEALLWMAKASSSQFYKGWHEGIGDYRNDVYRQKIVDTWKRWIPKTKEILLDAMPFLEGRLA